MRVTLSLLAERDLESIGDYIAEDNPRRALGFVAELRAQCEKCNNPDCEECKKPGGT